MNEIMGMMMAIARQSDASIQEVEEARDAYREAFAQLAPWEALMDVLAASRIDQEIENGLQGIINAWSAEPEVILDSQIFADARAVLEGLDAFHHQVMFPEVMWRENPGFDVIVGNPPWEEATIEEDDFWTRYVPGMQGLRQHERDTIRDEWRGERPDLVEMFEAEQASAERTRLTLSSGTFPGMETGDPDLYKAFCWRFLHLLRQGGQMGVVLPRSAVSALGSAPFRRQLFESATFDELTTLVNNGGWVFSDVHPQYSINLVTITNITPNDDSVVPIRGPFNSLATYKQGLLRDPVQLPVSVILGGSDAASIPLLPTTDVDNGVAAMAQMRLAPRFDLDETANFRFRPVGEFHATNDRPHMIVQETPPSGSWPVYGGQSFDIWNHDTGSYFAYIVPETATTELNRKRRSPNRRSPFYEMDEAWRSNPDACPCLHPRVAFRDITRATDQRTMRAALIPPNVVITNKGPYLLRVRGSEADEAHILGIMSSIPFDWFARRYVEISMNFFILAPLPVPRPDSENPLRIRLIELSGRLAAQDERFTRWAQAVGVDCGAIGDDVQQEMIMELDAVVSLLYGLSANQLRAIYRTFHHNGTVDGEPWEQRFNAVMVYYSQHGGVVG